MISEHPIVSPAGPRNAAVTLVPAGPSADSRSSTPTLEPCDFASAPPGELGAVTPLVGSAATFHGVVSKLPMLASTRETCLITGETGTGKELFARAIHRLGPRKRAPFVAVNCGSLVDTLLEGELFGHERGAFTDAHARRQGLVAHAAGGTLFLDEAEALVPRAQITLLRVLQEGFYRPLGSATEQRSDVRFLAATNDRLDLLVQKGHFRADLYYRLSVFTVTMPPLRERREDILALATHFVAKHWCGPGGPPRLAGAAAQALLAFDWPGNVRELESAIVRAVHLAREGTIQPQDLGLPGHSGVAQAPEPRNGNSYKAQKRQIVDAFERQYLDRLMGEHAGNVTRAAIAAGKERRDLGKLLKRHGVDPQRFARKRSMDLQSPPERAGEIPPGSISSARLASLGSAIVS